MEICARQKYKISGKFVNSIYKLEIRQSNGHLSDQTPDIRLELFAGIDVYKALI
jgi:hypothetical protein